MRNARNLAGVVETNRTVGPNDSNLPLSQKPIDLLLQRLDGVLASSNASQWRARCPGHESKSRTLSIRELDDGRVLLFCFADCEPSAVLAAVELTLRDLFPRTNAPQRGRQRQAVDYRMLLDLAAEEIITAGLVIADHDNGYEADLDRLWLAWQRIMGVLSHARTR